MWKSEDDLQGLVLPFHDMGSKGHTRVPGLAPVLLPTVPSCQPSKENLSSENMPHASTDLLPKMMTMTFLESLSFHVNSLRDHNEGLIHLLA